MRSILRGRATAGLVLSLALVATACSSDDDGADSGSDSGTEAADEGGEATGTVPIAGSSTVFPITSLVAEDVQAESGVDASVQSTGSSGGFRDFFCLGSTAINNSSRPINEDDIALCAENGVENILEIKVGIDGMTVMTSPDNDAIGECLDFPELYALLGPESGDVASWADANDLAAELGGSNGSPFEDVPLTTAGPGTESGTYDSFLELVMEDIAEARIEEGVLTEDDGLIRPDWQGNNDDNLIIEALIGNPYSLGWVGYAYYLEVEGTLRAFDVADGEGGGCVTPTPDTIASGEYPLARDLFIYVNLDKLEGEDYSDSLETFLDYYVSDAGYELVAEAGYVQLTEEAWAEEAVAAWEAREPNV